MAKSIKWIDPYRYCYWSVCIDEKQHSAMEKCITSARNVGVFREFKIFCKSVIQNADCYEANEMDVPTERRYLVYLSAGVNKLGYEYVIWLESNSEFIRNPGNPLITLSGAPIHVPLMRKLGNKGSDRRLFAIYMEGGVPSPPYLAVPGFWVLKTSALDHVCSLAAHSIAIARNMNENITGDEAMGYACQMLCGNPDRHRLERYEGIWCRKGVGKWRSTSIISGI